MADTKVVVMVIKAELQCDCCCKKVKKVLCKFPQIRDQIYDEKKNLVIIKVLCCNPEKLRDQIFCMGRGVITTIEIKPPEVPPPIPDTQTAKKKDPPPEGKKKDPVVVQNPPPVQPVSVNICVPVQGYPPPYPMDLCCRPCCEGQGGGPCSSKHGRPCPCPSEPERSVPCSREPERSVPCSREPERPCPCPSGHGRPGPCCDGCASGRPIPYCYGGGSAQCYVIPDQNAPGCSAM